MGAALSECALAWSNAAVKNKKQSQYTCTYLCSTQRKASHMVLTFQLWADELCMSCMHCGVGFVWILCWGWFCNKFCICDTLCNFDGCDMLCTFTNVFLHMYQCPHAACLAILAQVCSRIETEVIRHGAYMIARSTPVAPPPPPHMVWSPPVKNSLQLYSTKLVVCAIVFLA